MTVRKPNKSHCLACVSELRFPHTKLKRTINVTNVQRMMIFMCSGVNVILSRIEVSFRRIPEMASQLYK